MYFHHVLPPLLLHNFSSCSCGCSCSSVALLFLPCIVVVVHFLSVSSSFVVAVFLCGACCFGGDQPALIQRCHLVGMQADEGKAAELEALGDDAPIEEEDEGDDEVWKASS